MIAIVVWSHGIKRKKKKRKERQWNVKDMYENREWPGISDGQVT